MDVEDELRRVIARVVNSKSAKKLIVAGPGTGKTALFRELLETSTGDRKSRLVLTFINNLKSDLEKDLADLASVFTLHGYCQLLLHCREGLRQGLTGGFRCLPGLASLIKDDWEYLGGQPAPAFVQLMRGLEDRQELEFYMTRSNYYDGVDFDDSVFRVYQGLKEKPTSLDAYDLVLIDEYQDFNRMEAGFIQLLAARSPIVIAGDDDQALYGQLRGSSWEFIRSLWRSDEYERFELPFCLRCPEVIVGAVNDVVSKARQLRKLEGRIEKPYRHYGPVKGEDSKRYPKIGLVMTTVQRLNANYFGQYIERAITKIPNDEVEEANTRGDPVVLIIGSKQYLRQIATHLTGCGYTVDSKRDSQPRLEKVNGLEILASDPESNLGWRVMLEFEKAEFRASKIREATEKGVRLVDVMPTETRENVLHEVRMYTEETSAKHEESGDANDIDVKSPVVKMTSFEGAKGLSAQHVFIAGMHEGDLPRDARSIQDIEICRFVVGLTRTRKKCSMLCAKRFADQWKHPSPFLSWIKGERYEITKVDAGYWKKTEE
jgi:hypothetical protein